MHPMLNLEVGNNLQRDHRSYAAEHSAHQRRNRLILRCPRQAKVPASRLIRDQYRRHERCLASCAASFSSSDQFQRESSNTSPYWGPMHALWACPFFPRGRLMQEALPGGALPGLPRRRREGAPMGGARTGWSRAPFFPARRQTIKKDPNTATRSPRKGHPSPIPWIKGVRRAHPPEGRPAIRSPRQANSFLHGLRAPGPPEH